MTMRYGLSAVLGGMLALSACGSEEPGDVQPNVTIDNLTTGQPLMGTVQVEVTAVMWADVAKVELFATDIAAPLASSTEAPFTVAWDTSTAPLGALEVHALATDKDGNEYTSPKVLVAVVHGGVPATMLNLSSGNITIPANYDGSQEVDMKHHWNNPAGIHTIVVITEWDAPAEQEPWDIETTVGSGTCPHSGVVLSGAFHSVESPVVLITTDEDGFDATQFFVHLRPLNALDHLGLSVPYQVSIFLIE